MPPTTPMYLPRSRGEMIRATATITSTQDQGVIEEVAFSATLKSTSGASVGLATFQGAGQGTEVSVQVQGLTPGTHTVTVTSVGECAGDFTSAGDALSQPESSPGGESQSGVLPTILVTADGNGEMTTTSTALAFEQLTEAPGTALVIGSGSGDESRVACGVVEPT